MCRSLERTEMAPYAKTLPSSLQPPSSDLIAKLEAKNEEELKKFDEKIKAAEESLGETDPSESMREKAGYLCQIGDKVRVLRCKSCQSPRLTDHQFDRNGLFQLSMQRLKRLPELVQE
jgi:hypothetical protein